MKSIWAKYGFVGSATYVGLSLANLGLMYVLVKENVNMKQLGQKFGADPNSETFDKIEEAGPFVAAYLLHKISAPVRVPISLGLAALACKTFVKK